MDDGGTRRLCKEARELGEHGWDERRLHVARSWCSSLLVRRWIGAKTAASSLLSGSDRFESCPVRSIRLPRQADASVQTRPSAIGARPLRSPVLSTTSKPLAAAAAAISHGANPTPNQVSARRSEILWPCS
jgi:hypothetical protein